MLECQLLPNRDEESYGPVSDAIQQESGPVTGGYNTSRKVQFATESSMSNLVKYLENYPSENNRFDARLLTMEPNYKSQSNFEPI